MPKPELEMTERVRRAIVANRRVTSAKEQLERAEMQLAIVTEGFTQREITLYAKHTGAIPKDNRPGNAGRKKVVNL